MRPLLIILAAALLLAAGCATTIGFESAMNNHIGRLTYDEALVKWGPPAAKADGDRVTVARWEKTSGAVTSFSPGYAMSSRQSSVLTVTFDKETKRMITWTLE